MLDNPEKYAGLVPFGCRMEERFVWWYPLCYAWADIWVYPDNHSNAAYSGY